MKKKGIISTLLTVIMVATLLVGCDGSTDGSSPATEPETALTSAPENGEISAASENLTPGASAEEGVIAEEVALSVGADIADLAPWSSTSQGRMCVMPTIYEYLAYYDASAESGIAGVLMKDFEQVDELTYRVTIFDYIYDSAGNHLTAEDVAWCFNTWKEEGKSVKCKSLDSCTVVDEYTVEIKLTADIVGEVQTILCGQVPIVTKAAYDASGDGMIENVVSTAPYVVTDYVSGSHLTVEKNEKYWQTDESLRLDVSKANAKKITFKIITEKSQVAINLETGAIDIAPNLDYSEASRFEEGGESAEGYSVFSSEDPSFMMIAFNCSEGGMFENNQALRQAICYSIDSPGLVKGVLSGAGVVNKAFANPVCADYNTAWDQEDYYDYNVDKANELLKTSGFDTSKTIRIMCPSVELSKSSAQVIQAYLLQLGINCEILAYDAALFQTYKTDPTQWDIILDSRMSNDYVSSLTSVWIAQGETKALGFVQDDKLQTMATSVCTASGHTEEAINEYMEYIKDQCYAYALFHVNNYYVVEDTIKGVFVNYKGYLLPGVGTYSADYVR